MDIDLEQMELKQLRELRGRVDRAIADFEDRRRRNARAAAEEAARQHGFSLADLAGERPARSGRKPASPAKYANPENPSQTWSGRGRRPGWVQQMLDSGRSLDELAV